jgi:hypothetical protein
MKTQAWGWLAVAVVAAGLNASYHDGGLAWAHRIAGRISHNTNAVLALATGRADQFVAEAQLIEAHEQASHCPVSAAVAEMRRIVAPAHSEFDEFEAMSARQEAALARLEANRARIEAEVARVRIPAVAFDRIVVPNMRISACPRVRVNIPRMPGMRMRVAPMAHVENVSFGPV